MTSKRFSAIILAAGFSSRMQEFKPLLKIGDIFIAELAVRAFASAGVKDIKLVTGHRGAELTDSIRDPAVSWVENPEFEKGMFSSIKAGVLSLKECDAFFILPVDIPLVRSRTIKNLMHTYIQGTADIIYPVFQGTRGHPPLLSMKLAREIMEFHGSTGLNKLLEQHNDQAAEINVADEGILLDCDSSEDYRHLLRRYERYEKNNIPSRAECMELLTGIFHVEENIIAHSQVVAGLATYFAKALRMSEKELDLVTAAGLLHDLARKEPDHDKAGAAVVNELGYPRVAEIIKDHMDISISENDKHIDPSQIVYLADKLVEGSRIMNLEERFGKKMVHFDNPEAKATVQKRLSNALKIKERIENDCGRTLEEMLLDFSDNFHNDLFT